MTAKELLAPGITLHSASIVALLLSVGSMTHAAGPAFTRLFAEANGADTSVTSAAGMTRLKSAQLSVQAIAGQSFAEFEVDENLTTTSGGDPKDSDPVIVPAIYYVRPLGEDWRLGLSMNVPSGFGAGNGSNWAGRYYSDEFELVFVAVNATLAYPVNDWLSLGGGPQIMYADLELKAKAPPPNGNGEVKIDGDDIAFGFGLGGLIEVSEHTRFGIVYQSEIEPEFDGDVKTSGSGPGFEAATDTKITLARFIKVSGYHELNDQWALLGTVGWEDWSSFDNVNISTGQGSQKIPRNWDDTWKFAAGVHFRPVDNWLLQAGFSYDTSPVDSDDRTPDMPIDRQIRYATGVQYKWSDRLSTGAQFVYADYGKAKIDNDLLKGDYKRNDIFFFALNANWKF